MTIKGPVSKHYRKITLKLDLQRLHNVEGKATAVGTLEVHKLNDDNPGRTVTYPVTIVQKLAPLFILECIHDLQWGTNGWIG